MGPDDFGMGIAIRKAQRDGGPTAITVPCLQGRACAVELLQAGARVRQADALVCGGVAGGKSGSVVLHANLHHAVEAEQMLGHPALG
jgi:hypothetical protein